MAASLEKFFGTSDGKRLKLETPDRFRQLLEFLSGHEIELTLQKRRRQRSVNQNAYFHGVCLPMIAEAAGYDRSELQEVKDALKVKFLPMSRPGVGIDAYRRMTDELAEIIKSAVEGEIPPGHAVRTMAEKVQAVLADDDRSKLQLVRSTADLDTAEFTHFIEDCRRWAAQTLHCNIPDPQ